jgi:hypothetical protein
MNWTLSPARITASVALALALAGVATGSLLATGTARAATGSATSRVAGSSDYTIATSPNGAGMNVNVTVNGDWHINKAYPVKFNSKPVDAGKITYAGPSDNPNAVTVAVPDAKAGKLKFGYCKSDGSSCAFGEVDVKL